MKTVEITKSKPWEDDSPQFTKGCRHILVGTPKGGSGKSLIAFQLATGLLMKGKRVVVADGDPQQSIYRRCMKRNDMIKGKGIKMPVLSAMRFEYKSGVSTLKSFVEKWQPEYIIYDVGGSANHELQLVMGIADLIIAPIVPGDSDLDALKPLQTMVRASNSGDRKEHGLKPIQVSFLLNRLLPNSNSIENRTLISTMNMLNVPEFVQFSQKIKLATRISQAASQGLNIVEFVGEDDALDVYAINRYVEFLLRGNL